MIYFDNNATTMMHPDTINKLVYWCNRGNPSSSYASAKAARKMMEELRQATAIAAGVRGCCADDRELVNKGAKTNPALYKIILTSGASEANAMIINGVVRAYRAAKGTLPHVISSSIEHKSILLCLQDMEAIGEISLTLIPPSPTGHIRVLDIQNAILPNTCLICVMHANNETGAINDISQIAEIAHANSIAFHSDTVQSFGKIPFNMSQIDSFAISYHKVGGPPGVGALCVKQALIIGYDFPPLIYGTQNGGLRGGTENIPGFGAALEGMKIHFGKKPTVSMMKDYIMTELRARAKTALYKEYVKDPDAYDRCIIFLTNNSEYYLPNTILLTVVKKKGKPVCNVEMKNALEARGIIVSVGSACNTASAKASHVLDEMGADMAIKKGTLRISLCNDNTMEQCKTFIKEYLLVVIEQLKK